MIFTIERFKLKANGKSSRGYIQFRQFVTKRLGGKEQDVGVLLCDMSEPADKKKFMEYCESAFDQYILLREAEELLEKLKGEEM
jgi:uncharacterized membrane protein